MIPNRIYNMLIEFIPMILLFSIVMILVRIVTIIYAKEKVIIYKELKNLLYIVYCFVLFNLVTATDFVSYSNNFTPFKEITRYVYNSLYFYRNVIGNIVLFIPFGYIICDMIHEKAGKINILIPTIIATLTSLSIETIQMFIGRSFDIDDIILNFIGGLIGCIIFKIFHKLMSYFPIKFQTNMVKLIAVIIMILIMFLAFLFVYKVVL